MSSLLRTILFRALRHPRRVAIIDDQRTSTYLRLSLAVFTLGDLIRRTTANRHVGFMLPTGGAMPTCILASWQVAKVPIPLNFLLGHEELRYVIEHSGIDTLFTATAMLDFIGGRSVLPEALNVVCLDKQTFPKIPPVRWPRDPADDELATILYTSGTSGKPKGVMLTQGNLRRNVVDAITHAELKQADTFLGVLPQFHSFGLTALSLIPLYLGSKVVYTARFIPRKIIDLAKQHRPDVFMAVPSMYNALLNVKDVKPGEMHAIRMPISGGEPLPAAVREGCQKKLGLELLEGYGLTETSPVATWCTPTRKREKSVGQALPGVDLVIVDDQDRPLGRNADGEILIAGPNIMRGYYKQDELTREVMIELEHPAGSGKKKRFFRSGDIGRIDDDGFLYITGRKKEMLIIGGLNVFPRDIEEVLNRHPSVKDSAVIGRPDDSRGEVAVAYVEMKEGMTFDRADLRDWCAKHLASYKVPRDVVHVLSLPRSPTGKILRRKLKEEPVVAAES
jgi:long-chain acyl-CoA synthetase